ncbi:hypothetical protein [Legionella fairfieldensis]|nr:hypothetical protein [Legionella fairfieldensis]
MKKILMLAIIVTSSAFVTGCAFTNCGYSYCTSCCNETVNCCGSNGWY